MDWTFWKVYFLCSNAPQNFKMDQLRLQSWAPIFDKWVDINFRYFYEALLDYFKIQAMIDGYCECVGSNDLLS